MNELEFCIVGLAMVIVCCVLLIGMLVKKTNYLNEQLDDVKICIEQIHYRENATDEYIGRNDACLYNRIDELTKRFENHRDNQNRDDADSVLGRLNYNEMHLDNIDELLREMLPDHERLVRHLNHKTIKNKNAEWFDVDGEYIKPIDTYKSKRFLK